MSLYDSILIPTDGSDGVEQALEHAIDLAKNHDATLHTLYVVELTALPAEFDPARVYDELEAEGRTAIGAVADRAEDADVPVEAYVASGPPHRAILDYVPDHDIDLIIMGTHGRTGLDRYLLGSVTEKVVRLSEVPVLTVRTGPGQSSADTEA
jgi:nucleotide-binding universal stress UspA family protein